MDLAATAVVDVLAAFPPAELIAGFQSALSALPLRTPVTIAVIERLVVIVIGSLASATAFATSSATTDYGRTAVAAAAPGDCPDGH
jgi:hypothetical protein